KLNTSWVQPNETWDSAVADFIAKILDPSPRNRFLESFIPLVEQVALAGAINSLAQTLLKLTAPGVPDIYQGNEIWDFSLVDPDNRRPVDYAQRQKMLDGLNDASPEDLLGNWRDGRIKLFLTHRLLAFRRENADLFRNGSYVPLAVAGDHADCAIAFAREFAGKRIVVLAPRLSSRVGFPPLGSAWGDTALQLPAESGMLRDLFTDQTAEGNPLRLADAFAHLPFAVLM
ncbi:MAG: malto-oligosyltrehalose synthase, partial [Chthoniobacterales bacterium]